jgi:hypothetical protein
VIEKDRRSGDGWKIGGLKRIGEIGDVRKTGRLRRIGDGRKTVEREKAGDRWDMREGKHGDGRGEWPREDVVTGRTCGQWRTRERRRTGRREGQGDKIGQGTTLARMTGENRRTGEDRGGQGDGGGQGPGDMRSITVEEYKVSVLNKNKLGRIFCCVCVSVQAT